LGEMIDNIFQGQQNPKVRKLADKIVEGIHHTDKLGRMTEIYGWVTRKLEWKPDPASVDKAVPIWETLDLGGGDCDCLTTAFCTLAEAVGCKTWLFTVPREHPKHVLAVARVSEKAARTLAFQGKGIVVTREGNRTGYWLPFDPSIKNGSPGVLVGTARQHAESGDFQIIPIRS